MTRRRSSAQPRRPVAGPAGRDGSIGVWYALLIGAVLLIALGLYAYSLYRQVEEWRDAAEQLSIGQELLRADRDDILEKAREREATLANLEAGREEDQIRLEGLENQRHRLQQDVLRLTQTLAKIEQQENGADADPGQSADVERLSRERDRLDRELAKRDEETAEQEAAVVSLKAALDEKEEARRALDAEKADLDDARAALEAELERVKLRLAERRQDERLRQIIRGHQASLGEVKPYVAEVGPGDWSVIESWLAQQLGRPMAVPDLSDQGLSYEGARLIGNADGPPLAMLLYADAEEQPVSLTIGLDRAGEQPLAVEEEGGLTMVEWREERHAFILVGGGDETMLEAIGIGLLNNPPRLSEDAPVPISRYVRPGTRPANGP